MNIKSSYDIAVYGDSISKGVIYDEEKSRYVVLQESFVNIVQTKLKGMIHNAAKFGNTIIRGAVKLQNDVLQKTPDIMVIEFGGNDCDFLWDEIAKNPTGHHVPNTDLATYAKQLLAIITMAKERCITPVLMTLPPLDADRYLKWISKNSLELEKSILRWLGSASRIYWWHERYNSAIIKIAQETKTRWIDIRGAFLEKEDYRYFLCKDGIHPNEQGHRLIAERIIEYIRTNYRCLLRDDPVC